MAKCPHPETVASHALAALLASKAPRDRDLIATLGTQIHYTMLWKWASRRRQPDLERAFLLQTLSKGRFKAQDWTRATEAPALAATGTEG